MPPKHGLVCFSALASARSASMCTDDLVSGILLRALSHRTRKQICMQICLQTQTLWCCLQAVWTLPLTIMCSKICMRVLRGALRPVWTGPKKETLLNLTWRYSNEQKPETIITLSWAMREECQVSEMRRGNQKMRRSPEHKECLPCSDADNRALWLSSWETVGVRRGGSRILVWSRHWTVLARLRYFLTLTLFTSLPGSIPKNNVSQLPYFAVFSVG